MLLPKEKNYLIDEVLSQKDYTLFDKFSLEKTKPYVPLSYCVLKHILHNEKLPWKERLYYLLADSLSYINGKNVTQQRSISLSSSGWTAKLNCSKSEIFLMQKNLEEKGYFIIIRDKISTNKLPDYMRDGTSSFNF